MKIGVIAPPVIPVPPPLYGGTELVVYNLVQGLTSMGNDVTLYASKDSDVSCELKPYLENEFEFGLNSPDDVKAMVYELATKYAYTACALAKDDIIHDHTLSFPIVNLPVVHTLHGPNADFLVRKVAKYSEDKRNNFVFISNRQKELYLQKSDKINIAGIVLNSVDVKNMPWTKDKEDFLLFMGRSNWEKGLDLAIRVASKSKSPLIMSVKMSEDFEKEFFKKEIRPWIDSWPKDIFFKMYDEITKDIKTDLYCRAKCTLFTSQWEEPFGLVMIESMACGTPVIALKKGAAPEVIVDGVTGFLVDNEDEMIKAVERVGEIDPAACRKHVEDNFSLEIMAENYFNVYKNVIANF